MKKLCILLALAAEGDALLGHAENDTIYFNYCFTDGETLYLSGYDMLYTYRVGDADLTPYAYELPETEEAVDTRVMPFSVDGELYALTLSTSYGENSQFVGADICALTLDGNGSAQTTSLCQADWKDLVEEYDDSVYPIQPESLIGANGKLVIRYYTQQGEYETSVIDVQTGARHVLSELQNAYAVTDYRDGLLLVEQYDYNEADKARLLLLDPSAESLQPLGEVSVEEYSPLSGLAYDAETDAIYCIKGGEICPVDLKGGEIGAGLTDMPLQSYGGAPGCVLKGGYYAYCGDGAAIRNLDPEQKAATRLKINDSTWSDSVSNAYYRFANAHGDVSVVLSREWGESSNLIEKMMNRDDSIDIYLLSTSSAIYDALFNRGYLMELDGSEKAMALAERMYPSLRECLSRDGHLVALPVTMNAWTIGINEKALEALGLKLEDVPENWSDFLDFVSGLGDKLAENKAVHLFYSGYTADDARNDLFNSIFDDYQRYVNATDPTLGYDTELLRGLLEKLEQVDFTALGCLSAEEAEEGAADAYVEDSDAGVLLQTGTGCSIGNFYSDYTPILLRVNPEEPARLVLENSVAIVNPFTKNPEAAMAFIDELVDNLPAATLYCVDPELNEPVRGQWYEEYIAEVRKTLEHLNGELEKAEAADRQMIEEDIRATQENLDYMEENGWDVSPREVEWYRAHDDHLVTATVNWLYSDDSGEAWELIDMYRQGQIGMAEMLEKIDRKVQMMLREGN